MKPSLLFERGVTPQHSFVSLLLWMMSSLLPGPLLVLPPCCTAMRLPTAHVANHRVVYQPRSVDAEASSFFSQKSACPPATPPLADFACLRKQNNHKRACGHIAATAGQNRGNLSCLGGCAGDFVAVFCRSCFVNGHGNSGAAQDETPCCCCCSSSISVRAGCGTPCDASGEHCWSRTSRATAIDDHTLQQRLQEAARIYASPVLSETLRLHNRQRAAEQQHAQMHVCPQQRPQHTQESQPQPRQRAEQQIVEEESHGWQHQPVQQQSNPLVAHYEINPLQENLQQQENGQPQRRQLHAGCTAVAEDDRKQQQRGTVRPSGCSQQAGAIQVASRRAATGGAAANRSDTGVAMENSEECEAAEIDLRVSGRENNSYASDVRRKGDHIQESASSVDKKHSSSCPVSQTQSSSGQAEEVRHILPLARPTGWLLRQLQHHSCDRSSLLMQLKYSLFSSDSDVQLERTCAGSRRTDNAEGDGLASLWTDESHTADTAGAQFRCTNTKQSTRGAPADVQRLLDASVIVARVVRCAKCSDTVRTCRREVTNTQIYDELQSNNDNRIADVWHVLPASGFFVHKSGVLVTSFHVIAPFAEQYLELHRERQMAAHEGQQMKGEDQLQLPAKCHRQSAGTLYQSQQQQQSSQSEDEQQHPQQFHREMLHRHRVHRQTGRKELKESSAAASALPLLAGDAVARDDVEVQSEKVPQTEVLVAMDRRSRCWPVKRILAASSLHDLAVLEIDWEGVIPPGAIHSGALPTAPAVAPTPTIATAAPQTAAASSPVRDERGVKRSLAGGQGTALQQQQLKKQQSKGRHKARGQPHDEQRQEQRQQSDSQQRVGADSEERQSEDRTAMIDPTRKWWKQLQQQRNAENTTVPWLRIEKRGALPGRPVLVCSNPSGRFFSITSGIVSRLFLVRCCPHRCGGCCSSTAPRCCHCPPRLRVAVTADFAQGSSGGAAVDAETGAVIGVAQSTSSLYCSTSAGIREGATPVFQARPLHPPLQMVVKTCIPVESLELLIDEALAQQQALSPRCASDSCSSIEPGAAAAA